MTWLNVMEYMCLKHVYICIAVKNQVNKTGVLGSSQQDGSVGIQSTRRECWDPVNKTGVLGFSQQDGSVGIQLTRREYWGPVNKTGVLGSS